MNYRTPVIGVEVIIVIVVINQNNVHNPDKDHRRLKKKTNVIITAGLEESVQMH